MCWERNKSPCPLRWNMALVSVCTLRETALEAILGHLKREGLFLSALPLLTRCPSPISPWCAASRPSCGHGWGGPPAPASSGPGFHSSRAKAGGTNPPHSSVDGENQKRRDGGGKRESVKGDEWKGKLPRRKEKIEGKTRIRKRKYTADSSHPRHKWKQSDRTRIKRAKSTLRGGGRPRERSRQRLKNGFVQISFSVLLLFCHKFMHFDLQVFISSI